MANSGRFVGPPAPPVAKNATPTTGQVPGIANLSPALQNQLLGQENRTFRGGATGATGPTGATGATGPTGPTGATGATGAGSLQRLVAVADIW